MIIAILSDIHGNMFALSQVMADLKRFHPDGIILLGDLIDYGMQSNEVVDYLQSDFPYDVICNIWGNHERAILTGDYSGFSSERGEKCARYTASVLTEKTKNYLDFKLNHEGKDEFILDGRRCLAIHGSLENPFWDSVFPDNPGGDYRNFDLVFCGHSHESFFFTRFYDADNPKMRNKKITFFINPGSVGQPRNHNPNAQYMILDTISLNISYRSVPYSIEKAMALYDNKEAVDSFYRERLLTGV